jgi:O-antigen/teichoic acid export membrane protein
MSGLPDESVLNLRIASNSLVYFLSQLVSKGLFFVTTVYLARALGASVYGKFAFAFSLVTIFSVITKFGLDPLLSRNVSENRKKAAPYFANTLALRSILTVPFFLLLLVSIVVLRKPADVNRLILLLALSAAFQSFAGAGTSLLEAFQMFPHRSVLNICMYGFVLLGAMIAFHLKPDLVGIGIGFAAASLFYGAMTLWFSHRKATPLEFTWNKTSLWVLFRSASRWDGRCIYQYLLPGRFDFPFAHANRCDRWLVRCRL